MLIRFQGLEFESHRSLLGYMLVLVHHHFSCSGGWLAQTGFYYSRGTPSSTAAATRLRQQTRTATETHTHAERERGERRELLVPAPSEYESIYARRSFQLRPCRIQRCPKLVISSYRRRGSSRALDAERGVEDSGAESTHTHRSSGTRDGSQICAKVLSARPLRLGFLQ